MTGSAGDLVQARDISGGIHFHQITEQHGVVPAQLPGDLYGFVNRTSDLELLDRLLCPGDDTPSEAAICVVTGTPGVGKTSLAIHWAHRVRERFPNGQLYINLRGYDSDMPVDAQRALGGFLIALGVAPGSVPAHPDERSSLYRSLLSQRETLILLDNAATTNQVTPLLPGAGRSRVLITSRGLLSGLAARGGARRVTLSLFTKSDSVELLRRTTSNYRSEDDELEVAELAQLCARLPLALRIAAERAAARPRMTMAELIRDLRDESSLWAALSTDDPEDADAVRSVFSWSYRALPEATARLFRLLGIFPGAEFSSEAAAALSGLSHSAARRLLGHLVDAHLVEQSAADRYQFHDLLRAYANDQAQQIEPGGELRLATERIVHWYLRCAEALTHLDPYAPGHRYVQLAPPVDGEPTAHFADYESAIAWFHGERSNVTAVVKAAVKFGLTAAAWQIPALLRLVYDRERAFDDWFEVMKLGIDAIRSLDDHEGLVYLLESLGRAYVAQYAMDHAEQTYSELLALCRVRGDHFSEAVTLNAVGLVEIRRHRMAEAIAYFERCDALCTEHGFRELTVNPATNLAQALLEFGRPEEALAMGRRAVATNREVGSKQAEMYALLRLSTAELEAGDPIMAAECVEQARSLAEASHSRAEEGIALLYAAAVQLAQNLTDTALESYQRAAAVARRSGDRQREALALRGVARVHRAAARSAEALEMNRAVLLIWRSLADRWQTALTLTDVILDLPDDRRPEARGNAIEALELIENFDDPAAVRLRLILTEVLA